MDHRLTPSHGDITGQSDALRDTLGRLRAHGAGRLDGRSWLFVGSGASYHAGTVAADWLRALGVPASASTPSSEAWMTPERWATSETVVVGLSRTGTTVETVEAIRAARALGAHTIGVSCTEDTPLLECAEDRLALAGVQERGRVMTRSFAALALAAQWLAAVAVDREDGARALEAVPEAIDATITTFDAVARRIAERRSEHVVVLGSTPHVGICEQARLQTLETARVHAEAYPVLEYRHGPLAGLRESTELVLLSTSRSLAADRLIGEDVARIGGHLTVCATAPVLGEFADDVERVELAEELDDAALGNAALPFLQLLAYHLTLELGRDPEAVRNLDRRIEPHVDPHAVDPDLFAATAGAASHR